ncbi:uncharacterized protein LOC111069172 isoform X2 [Drosophila obscura]|uniref:uncharacterized protein LOC111069172 isoform X2 n=1 Tax=Drosophila obscura TaxID=7282 RepID=UPI000BA0918A|nr:uncharacterized protein LOC111069172 isoform X2 [Drosophila obscura]
MGSIFRGLKRKMILDDSEEENEKQFCSKFPRMDTMIYPEVSLKQQKDYMQYLQSRFGQMSQRHGHKNGGNDEMDLAVEYCDVKFELNVSQKCEKVELDINDRISIASYSPGLHNFARGNDVKTLGISDFEVQGYNQFKLNINAGHSTGLAPCEMDFKGDKSNDHKNSNDKDLEVQSYEQFALAVVRHSTGHTFLHPGDAQPGKIMQSEDWLGFDDNFYEYFDGYFYPRS